MREEWDVAPCILPPSKHVNLRGVSSRRRSPEEVAAENQRLQEIYERECKEYEQRCKEAFAAWLHQRVELVQDRLKFLRRCQKTPGAEPRRRLRDCVYLMWCPSLGWYKIGHTDCLRRRTKDHRRHLDPKIEHRSSYYTPVSRRFLERFLLHHFRHFQVETDLSDELFDLPQKVADGFEAVAKAIEQHLLTIEVLRLKDLLLTFTAECQ